MPRSSMEDATPTRSTELDYMAQKSSLLSCACEFLVLRRPRLSDVCISRIAQTAAAAAALPAAVARSFAGRDHSAHVRKRTFVKEGGREDEAKAPRLLMGLSHCLFASPRFAAPAQPTAMRHLVFLLQIQLQPPTSFNSYSYILYILKTF